MAHPLRHQRSAPVGGLALDLNVGRRDRIVERRGLHGPLAASRADRELPARRKPLDHVHPVGRNGVVDRIIVGRARREIFQYGRLRSPKRLWLFRTPRQIKPLFVEGDAAGIARRPGPRAEPPIRGRGCAAKVGPHVRGNLGRAGEADDSGIAPGGAVLDPHQPAHVGRRKRDVAGRGDGDAVARGRAGRQGLGRISVSLQVRPVDEIRLGQRPRGVARSAEFLNRMVRVDQVHDVRRLGELNLGKLGLQIRPGDFDRRACDQRDIVDSERFIVLVAELDVERRGRRREGVAMIAGGELHVVDQLAACAGRADAELDLVPGRPDHPELQDMGLAGIGRRDVLLGPADVRRAGAVQIHVAGRVPGNRTRAGAAVVPA